jgi:hypothetical protein
MKTALGTTVLTLFLAATAGAVDLPAPLRELKPELRPMGTAALHWFGLHVYDIALFQNWMFLMDDEIMLNRAVMSKWGIRLGVVTLAFRKVRK